MISHFLRQTSSTLSSIMPCSCSNYFTKRTLISIQSFHKDYSFRNQPKHLLPSSSSSSSSQSSQSFFSSTSSTKRPFTILGLQQVAVGSTDLESLRYLWMDILGLPKVNTHSSEKENVMEDILVISPSSSHNSTNTCSEHDDNNSMNIPVELDLMCPIDENKSPKVCLILLLLV